MEENGNCQTNLKRKTERLERPEKEKAGITGKAKEKVSLWEKICRERKAGGGGLQDGGLEKYAEKRHETIGCDGLMPGRI